MHRARALVWLAFGSAIVVAGWHFFTVATIIGSRLRFPYDIDWLEGDQIYHSYRLLHGEPVYRNATEGFLPLPYPPVYVGVVAAAGAVFGLDYGTARAVSGLAFLTVMVVMGTETARHVGGGRRGLVFGLLGAAAVTSSYPDAYGYNDLARVDSLALAFVVLAVLASLRPGRRAIFWAGGLATCAVYTKQTMVFPVGALAGALFLRDRRLGVTFVAWSACLSGLALLGLELATHGAFLRTLLQTRHHQMEWRKASEAFSRFLECCPWLLATPLLLLWARTDRSRTWFAVLGGCVPAAVLPYIKAGGFPNDFIPVTALAGPVALIMAFEAARPRSWCGLGAAALLCAAALAYKTQTYAPARYRPTADAQARAVAASDVVRSWQGDVLCPLHPFFVIRSGHHEEEAPWVNHIDAIYGLTGATEGSYRDFIVRRHPDVILLDGVPLEEPFLPAISDSYVLVGELPKPSVGDYLALTPGPVFAGVPTEPWRVYRRIHAD